MGLLIHLLIDLKIEKSLNFMKKAVYITCKNRGIVIGNDGYIKWEKKPSLHDITLTKPKRIAGSSFHSPGKTPFFCSLDAAGLSVGERLSPVWRWDYQYPW